MSEADFAKLWTNPRGSQTKVRERPHRIVALEPARITECLLALGVVPVGSSTYEDLRTLQRGHWPPALHGHVPHQVADVGWYHEPPDAERIRAVNPDLILALGGDEDRRGEERRLRKSPLAGVAPMILLADRRSPDDRPAFIERLRDLAWLTDRADRAETLIDGYEARCAALRPLVAGELVAAVWFRAGKVAIYTRHHTSQVFTDLGITVEEPPGEPVWPSDTCPRARFIGHDGLHGLRSPAFVFTQRYVDASETAGFLSDPRWAQHPTVVAGNALFLGWPLLNSGYFSSHAQLDAIERLFGVTAVAARISHTVVRVGIRAARGLASWSVQGPALDGDVWIGSRGDRVLVLDADKQLGRCTLAGDRQLALHNFRLWVANREGLHEHLLVPDSVELVLQS
ncbi:MAG: ABC transporter substrate-binding protein [Pseudonocardiaceae bacterium]